MTEPHRPEGCRQGEESMTKSFQGKGSMTKPGDGTSSMTESRKISQ